MVGGDTVGDVLEHHRLTRPRCRNDETSLTHADGRHQINDACRDFLRIMLQPQLLLGIERREIVEENLLTSPFRLVVVDELDLEERKVPLALLRSSNLPRYDISGPQVEAANLAWGDIDVVGSMEVVRVGSSEEPETVGQDFKHTIRRDCTVLFCLRLQDGENEFLLTHRRDAVDVEVLGKLREFANALFLEGLEGELPRSSLASLSRGLDLYARWRQLCSLVDHPALSTGTSLAGTMLSAVSTPSAVGITACVDPPASHPDRTLSDSDILAGRLQRRACELVQSQVG